ncbi:hypothetical protein F5X96DRAFT_631574 [Biscogniauxia mediterranea]|nr:hypothetical protein F5X96DRAFT_631574 [Biscogniauxia mediterranea]
MIVNNQEPPRTYLPGDNEGSPDEWRQDKFVLARITCFRMGQYQQYLQRVRSSGMDPKELLTTGIEFSGSNAPTVDFYGLVAIHDRLLWSSTQLHRLMSAIRDRIWTSLKIGGFFSVSMLLVLCTINAFIHRPIIFIPLALPLAYTAYQSFRYYVSRKIVRSMKRVIEAVEGWEELTVQSRQVEEQLQSYKRLTWWR